MKVEKIHHVAYRCNDTRETVDFYKKVLDMDLILAISEERAPSTKAEDPYMHIFLEAGNGNVLAFFEIPNSPPMGRDTNTPEWVQHIAFQVGDEDALMAVKDHAEACGLDVVGPVDHAIFRSVYFFDPNGHRLECATPVGPADDVKRLNDVAQDMIDEWSKTKKPVKHAAWLHEKEFEKV